MSDTSPNETLNLNKYNVYYIVILTLSLIVVFLNIVGFFKFRAYSNNSSAMLILLNISMFSWTAIVFATCIWKD